MRLKINLSCNNLKLPINYQSILQGVIYSSFDKEFGDFIHDKGYNDENKIFKLFVFSNIFGEFTIKNHTIIFKNDIHFYISSQDDKLLQVLYDFLVFNTNLILNNQIVKIKSIKFYNLDYFEGLKEIKIKTLSPIVAFKTKDKYVNYYKPSDKEFNELCLNNLISKNNVLDNVISNICFQIINVEKEKKRLVKYKNTFYVGYNAEIAIKTNYETLLLIYNTGLSAKGSAGFGMIEVLK